MNTTLVQMMIFIEKHESGIEINSLQNKVRYAHTEKRPFILVLNEFVIKAANEGVALQKMGIFLPLIENTVTLQWGADGIQHIAVRLAVDTFLERLNGQAEVNFICRNILADVGKVSGLQRIQIDEET